MGNHGRPPVRIVEVVAESLHVSVPLDLAPPVQQIAGTILADDSLAGINLAHNVKNCRGFQCIGLKNDSTL